MKNLVFIFCIFALVSITKPDFFRKSTVASFSEKFQLQNQTDFCSFSNFISETVGDDNNILSEESSDSNEDVAANVVLLSAFVESGKKQDTLQPLIYDLPPPYSV